MIPIPYFGRISFRTLIEVVVAALLLAALFIQTARIEGLSVWPLRIHGLKAELADTKTKLKQTQAAFDQTVAGYRAAAVQARAADAANAQRVQAQQGAISSDTEKSYEDRIAAARADARRLRDNEAAAAHSSTGRGAPVSSVSTAAGGSAQGASKDEFSAAFVDKLADRICGPEGYTSWDNYLPDCERQGWDGSSYGLPDDDALTATEQAIQLDELIKWTKKQTAVDVNGAKKN